ncbi:hypothetical protein [Halorubrum amylolyticum]|uniref:hypothetical protein n=1 Tax=Halorubrum amylolyticum TaxID=2508724 RepID=UPI0010087BF6|nr:hypothetical protein [Halorubrum amylolyticum]
MIDGTGDVLAEIRSPDRTATTISELGAGEAVGVSLVVNALGCGVGDAVTASLAIAARDAE